MCCYFLPAVQSEAPSRLWPRNRAFQDTRSRCRRRDNDSYVRWPAIRTVGTARREADLCERRLSLQMNVSMSRPARSERSPQALDFRRDGIKFPQTLAVHSAVPAQKRLRSERRAKMPAAFPPHPAGKTIATCRASPRGRIRASLRTIPFYRRAGPGSVTNRPCILTPACRPPQYPCALPPQAAYSRGADSSRASRKMPRRVCDTRH
jgi:hypothetical protein